MRVATLSGILALAGCNNAMLQPHNDAAPPLAAELMPAQTFALLVGILEWQDPDFEPFPKTDRQDRVLESVLLARGVPRPNIVFLEDRVATRARILQELETMAARVPPGSTLLFYFAGHGDRANDETYLIPYDTKASDFTRTGIATLEVERLVRQNYAGGTVLMFGDFCHSGGLADVAKRLGRPNVQIAGLTSSTRDATSTEQWTFTEALHASLSGDPRADINRDGRVTFAEATQFVQRKMLELQDQEAASEQSKDFMGSFVLAEVKR